MIGSHTIERKELMRDLGLLIDPKCTFAAHMEQSTNKARQSMGYIKKNLKWSVWNTSFKSIVHIVCTFEA